LTKIVCRFVEICVLKIVKGKPRFLVLKRASNESIYPDIWQIVTGKIKKNESAYHAALRELKEETGLKRTRSWTVPFIDSFYSKTDDTIQISPVFAVEVNKNIEVKISSEHQTFKWLPYEKAKRILDIPAQKKILGTVQKTILKNRRAACLFEIK
jgi:dihydroneopterin triphosphate diphosphatase